MGGARVQAGIVHLGLLLVGALWMVPLIYMLSVSLRAPSQSFDPMLVSLPLTFDNFILVMRDNPLARIFMNSMIVTLATVAIVIASGAMFAFCAAILKLRGTGVLFVMLLTTLMVPIASLVLPLAILIRNFGWVNTWAGLIFPYAALGAPFAIVILKAFLDEAPRELFDAARVDGCNSWQIFRHVALPVIRPAIVFVAIWQFIVTWNEFFLALIILTEAEMKTLTIVPMQYSGLYMAKPGALFAILVLIASPLVILYMVIQRAFVGGLLAGAVKG